MNCGTTNESFLRNNQEWLKKSKLWSQFSAVASIGVVYINNNNILYNRFIVVMLKRVKKY